MRIKLKNISLYWKCQLAGWALFGIMAVVNGALNKTPWSFIVPAYTLCSVIGMFTSRLMKYISKRLNGKILILSSNMDNGFKFNIFHLFCIGIKLYYAPFILGKSNW